MLNKKFVAMVVATATLFGGIAAASIPAAAYAADSDTVASNGNHTDSDDNTPIQFKDPELKRALLDNPGVMNVVMGRGEITYADAKKSWRNYH